MTTPAQYESPYDTRDSEPVVGDALTAVLVAEASAFEVGNCEAELAVVTRLDCVELTALLDGAVILAADAAARDALARAAEADDAEARLTREL